MSSLPRDTIVGRYCSISFNVTVMGDNHPIVIDHYVWIEANVAMKHCIKIGNGSIIFLLQ